MPRFEFRFATLQRVQEQARDVARQRLSEAERALQILDQQLTQLSADRAAIRQRNRQQLAGQLAIDTLLDAGRYDVQLEAQQKQLSGQREQVAAEVQRRRERLVEHEQECRKLEKLRELAWQRYRSEEMRREQAALDEIAMLRRYAGSPRRLEQGES
jgi:flagellar FliJ protein